MGRRRRQSACAPAPSMLSSARGSPELRRLSASDAEVSAGAERATGSEAAPPGDRGGRTRGGGRSSAAAAATASSSGEAEGAEHQHRGDTPARKPDPEEAGGMDHHQLGTGRYQVVSARAPGRTVAPRPRGGPLPARHASPPAPGRSRAPSAALLISPGLYFPLPSFPSSLTQIPVSHEWCPPAAGLGARTCQGGDRAASWIS